MAANQTANFVVKAKDAATGPLGKVGGSMGKLRRTAGTAFKAIGAAAIAAGAALLAFTASAVKGAADDEKATIRLNAALKARGFEMDKLTPKVDEQIAAMARLGFTDDDVRAGLEVGSRFFKNQNNLLKANAVAANISAATGQDLASVMMALGKGAQGSTRGLAGLGIEVKKGAKLKDILRLADKKYLGVAEEVANSTSGKFAAAQITFNEAIEGFGAKLLPMVNEALTFLTETALPAFQRFLEEVGPKIGAFVDEYVRPLVDAFGELFDLASKGDFSIIDAALVPLKITFGALKILVEAIVAGIKFIQGFGGAAAVAAGSAARDYQTGGYARGDMGGQSSYLNTSQGLGTYIFPISIGTGKVDTVISNSIKRIGVGARRIP